MNKISEHLDAGMTKHVGHHVESWATEPESAAEFDRRVEACGLFERTFREVHGYYLTHRPGREQRRARIDRILIPGPQLREFGWTMTIGVEIKKSGCDFGSAVSQAIDYTYCTWNVGNYWMYCERIFLWPFAMPMGPLQSVMLQNGIGTVGGRTYATPARDTPSEFDRSLSFFLEREVISIDWANNLTLCHPTVGGKKTGSR